MVSLVCPSSDFIGEAAAGKHRHEIDSQSLLLSCIFPQLMIRILWPQSLEEEIWKNVRLF